MSASTWKGGTGFWAVAANWNGPLPNAATIDAVIGSGAPDVVTIGKSQGFTVDDLTIGKANATLKLQGSANAVDAHLDVYGTLTNEGTITVSTGEIGLTTLHNEASGSISVTHGSAVGGATLYNKGHISADGASVTASGVLNNTGTIAVSNGGDIFFGTSESTLGTISIVNSSLVFNGFFDFAMLQAYSGMGDKAFSSVAVDNRNHTLTVSADTIQFQSGSTFTGGVVVNQDNKSFTQFGGELDGVTVRGKLEIDVLTTVVNGLTLTGVNGTGAGRLALSEGTQVTFAGTQTFGNATVDVVYPTAPEASFIVGNGGRLTLASSLVFKAEDRFDFSINQAGALISDTTLQGAFYVDGQNGSFSNLGNLIARGGDVNLTTDLTNLSGTTLSGGHFEADAGSRIRLDPGDRVTTDASDLILDGTGSDIGALDTVGGTFVGLDETLTTIGDSGRLELLDGRGLTGTAAFVVNGALQLGGAAVSEKTLTVGAGGTLSGTGMLTGSKIVDDGVVTANGGKLAINGHVFGSGAFDVAAGATLEFGAPVTVGSRVDLGAGAGLVIDAPVRFHASVADFGAGNSITFSGANATTLTYVKSSDRLFLENAGKAVGLVQLTGEYAASNFALSNSGSDTIVTYASPRH